MLGLTWACVPSSSTTFTPSMTTTLEVFGEPLMVIASIDVQVVKLRFMLVSCTPGMTASMPHTSRPFIWMLVSCSAVTVPMRELVAVWTVVALAATSTDSVS